MTKQIYKYNDRIQLTKNINVSELKCKGNNHKHYTITEIEHIKMIQEFMDFNGFDKVIFSSGYRCENYNKKIGGSSLSQHTLGLATDQVFYKNNKVVSAKKICCLAQDFGFKGIGYIDENYVHLDSRKKGLYRGDESKNNSNNVNNDFYKYFNIKRENKYGGTYPVLPKRGYFKKNDKGTQVKKLQLLLNWILDDSLNVDGIIGNKTVKSVKEFQTEYNLKIDGLFGKDCLATAVKIEK